MPMLPNPPPTTDLRCTSGLGRSSLAPLADPVAVVLNAHIVAASMKAAVAALQRFNIHFESPAPVA